jgi:hypothetical protein
MKSSTLNPKPYTALQAEKLHETFQEKQETLKDTKQDKLFAEYGGAEHVQEKLPDRLRFGGTEVYKEYTQDGEMRNAFAIVIKRIPEPLSAPKP